MNSMLLQLLVLAGIAIFLILRLKSVLGTRDGYERPRSDAPSGPAPRRQHGFEVIEGGPDPDITDHVPSGSAAAESLARMKAAEPSFGVSDFLGGARGAYEMILMGFENGDLAEIKPFLSDDVYQTFAEVVEARESQGLKVEAEFIGVRELTLEDAEYSEQSGIGEVTVKFVSEMTSVVRDAGGEIVEGEPGKIKRQKDVWTFARTMGSDDPNWQLVATGE